MAFSSTLAFEVRNTGHADNAGFFNTAAAGSDYSQQDAPELIATDLEIHASVDTRIRSASRAPVTADIGNGLNVTAGTGFTVQRLQITGITSGYWDVDKSAGTVGSTGGSGRLGGALNSLATAFSEQVAGNWIYATGSYLLGTSTLTLTGGTSNRPTKFIGYGTTRGDNERVTIAADDGTPTIIVSTSGSYSVIRNVLLDCADILEVGLQVGLTGNVVENVRATNWTQRGIYSTGSGLIQDCESDNGIGGSGMVGNPRGCFVSSANGLTFLRCYARDSLSNGFVAGTGVTLVARDCIVDNMDQESATGGHGFWGQAASSSAHFTNCVFYGLEGSGIFASVASASDNMVVENCIFATIARYGWESTSTNYRTDATEGYARRSRGNAYYACALGNQDVNFPPGPDDITLTADPFVDAASGDFRLNEAVGGGALLRAAGVPGTFPGLTVTGAMDIGALQAGGTGTLAAGGLDTMTSLFREWTAEFSATRLPNSAVQRYLQSGLEEFNNVTGYNYADTDTTLVASTQEYDIPEDALEIAWVEHNGKRLEKGDVEQWESQGKDWRNEIATTPKYWAIYGNKLVLRPKPDAAAVAADSTLTIRYIRSPRDIAVYGPEQLAPAHYRAVVRHAVYEYSSAHPDSATAQTRREEFKRMFEAGAVAAGEFYLRRRMARGAPSEILLPSGSKRR